ncbi:hypothetical protein [Pseudomonas amygdali]|uniref:Uncharacterized protein n=2 Tax=Pseudomonas amygdali pv. lachrymans TaxID=53707 RepID=A0ABR5KTK8_PSEAV|nr:hypothetical protein [Pseudomonas amygdali]AXH60311.1 hypothetical protein PLA107_034585 [Pseudomonas amygdali pv. lachrymans str. M301315]KPC17699.1 Uncharacterized protein AC499_0901 [Pseudomonas amygdali pv. lachrymans]RMT06169.1 hypothetical protein ALP54_04126 [Pseudomonas amygdali pv. lachrymans]
MTTDRFTQTLQGLKGLQEKLAKEFSKDTLGEYVALEATLNNKLLGNDGLTLEITKLLLELLPSQKAHHIFLLALFGAKHSMDGDALSEMLDLFGAPDFDVYHASLAHMTAMFRVAGNNEVVLGWMLCNRSEGEGYNKVLREMVFKCIPLCKRNKPIGDSLVEAIDITHPDLKGFEAVYDFFRHSPAILSSPSLLLRSPQALLRDALLIRKKESFGDAGLQSSDFFKPGYDITPDLVNPILSDPVTQWAVLDIMTIASFKPIRFVSMSCSEKPSGAESALWAFSRMGASRIHAIAELDITVLARCFQHHAVFVDVCHKVLEGRLGEKVAGKLLCNMIEATMLLRNTRKLNEYPREYEDVVKQVLDPLVTPGHFQAIKGMRYDLYFAVNDQAAMMEESAPSFWVEFSTFRGWRSSRVRETFFASDLGL